MNVCVGIAGWAAYGMGDWDFVNLRDWWAVRRDRGGLTVGNYWPLTE